MNIPACHPWYSDVNHRWFKHIVLPSILGGAGKGGSLYKDANTQILQGNYGSITGRVGMPDGEALAGVIAGGMAERGSQLLTRQGGERTLPAGDSVTRRGCLHSVC